VVGNAADSLKKSSGSGTTISAKDISRARAQSSAEMLRRVPGLQVRTEDATGLRLNLGVRGLNPSRGRLVLVQEDGAPVAVSPYGEPELYYSTPIERIARIDVIKGSDLLLYGPQTVGGTVAFTTWSPPEHEEAVVQGDIGGYNYRKALVRYGNSLADGNIGYVIQAFRKQGDGFRGMAFEATDVMGKITFSTSRRSDLTLKLAAYDELSRTTYVGLTQPMYEENPRQDTVAPDDRFAIRRYEANLTHEVRFSPQTRLQTRVFAQVTDLTFRQQEFDRSRVDGVAYARSFRPFANDDSGLFFKPTATLQPRTYELLGLEPSVEHRFFTGPIAHKLTLGGRAMVDRARRRSFQTAFSTSDSGSSLSDSITTIGGFAGYLADQIAFRDYLVVTPTVRVEHSISKRQTLRVQDENGARDVNINAETTATGVMPGLAMVWGSPAFNVFGSLHSGYSPARVSQSIVPGGAATGLNAERSTNYELGTDLRPTRWFRARTAGFLINFDNQLISNNTLSGSSAEFRNGGKTRHLGGEMSLTSQLGRGLRLPIALDLQVNYTLAHSVFTGGRYDGNRVPYSPMHTAAAVVDVEHSSGPGAQVSITYVGQQYADELNTVEPDPSGRSGLVPFYAVVDAGLRYAHHPSGLTASLSVKNALDNVYLAGRLPNGIFTAGFRQAFASLSWSTR